MIEGAITPQARRALELAIIAAWWQPGSAAHIAVAFSTGSRKLHATDVQKIWEEAKEKGDLPKLNRPSVRARNLHIEKHQQEA